MLTIFGSCANRISQRRKKRANNAPCNTQHSGAVRRTECSCGTLHIGTVDKHWKETEICAL